MRALVGVVAIGIFAACSKEPPPPPTGSSADAGAGSARPTASAAAVDPPPSGEARLVVAGERPAIRESVATVRVAGKPAGMIRLFVSKLTPGDELVFALVFHADAAPKRDGGGTAFHEWSRTLAETRFVLKHPDGSTRALQIASAPRSLPLAITFAQEVRIARAGLTQWGETTPWKDGASELFPTPGRWALRVEGSVELVGDGGSVAYESDDLAFDVVPAGGAFTDLAAARAAAAAAVTEHLRRAPEPTRTAILDDVRDNRWVRFTRALGSSYDVEHVDVVITPSGKVQALTLATEFTCVAQGTFVTTPSGERPVETLEPGDLVQAWDPESRRAVVTPVVAVRSGTRSDLVRIGQATLTPEHPVHAGGSWIGAGRVRAGAILVGPGGAARDAPEVVAVSGPLPVHDLAVGWPHTYFAGGILVHNKSKLARPDRPWDDLFGRPGDAPRP